MPPIPGSFLLALRVNLLALPPVVIIFLIFITTRKVCYFAIKRIVNGYNDMDEPLNNYESKKPNRKELFTV
jgi:hypothetical protein